MASSSLKAALPGGYASVLAATVGVQFALVAASFPLGELFTATPLLHIDAAHHWYEIKVAVDLAQQGQLVGYDPFFAAGYLGGIPYNTSAKAPAAIAALFGGWISPAVAFKIFSFASAIAGPVAIPLAARSLRLGAVIGAIAAFLALILWWASPVRWYHTSGIVAWPIVVFTASWFAAALVAYATGKAGKLTFAVTAVLGCILFIIHPLFPLAAIFALMPLVWVYSREILPRRLPEVLLILPLICVAINLPWILAMMQAPGMADGLQPYQQAVDINMVWQDMLGLPSKGRGSKFYFVLVAFACWGMMGTRDRAQRRLATALFVGGVGTIIFADIGSVFRAAALVQPNRFSFQGYVLLLVPAALGAIAMVHALGSSGAVRRSALASAAFGAIAIGFYLNEVRRELSPGDHGHYGATPPEVRELGPISRWALQQLRTQTDTSARVMFELSHARVHDGAHIAGYLAVQSKREFIGGPYPYTLFANAWDNWAFGHDINTLPTLRFREYLALYNVGWILAHSPGLKNYLAGIPEATLVAQNEPLALYRVAVEHSFFLQGAGEVTSRAINQVDLANLQGDTIVLKYHYLPGMRAEPQAAIDGIRMLDDPVPFVRIRNPPSSLRLSLR